MASQSICQQLGLHPIGVGNLNAYVGVDGGQISTTDLTTHRVNFDDAIVGREKCNPQGTESQKLSITVKMGIDITGLDAPPANPRDC